MIIRHALSIAIAGLLLTGCSPSDKGAPPREDSKLEVVSLVFVAPDGSKSDTVRARAGDVVKTEMEVGGFTDDGTGKSVGDTAMWLKDSDNKIVYQDKKGVPFSLPYADGGKVSLSPSVTIPASQPAGPLSLTATVTDDTANQQTGKTLIITVE